MEIVHQDHRRLGKPWRTRTGLVVGSRYQPPPAKQTQDSERIQGALLKKPQPDSLGHKVATTVSVVGLFLLILALWTGVLP